MAAYRPQNGLAPSPPTLPPHRSVPYGGQSFNALPTNPYSTASQLLISYLYSYYNGRSSQARFFASNNLAFPADGLRAIGGFDATYTRTAGEDRELCDRWLTDGRRKLYAPDAVVYHAHALTFRTFWRQHFNYRQR